MSKKNCESEARKKIAASIGATPEEIYFTSGRADGHLKALKAVVKASKKARPHVIITMEDPEVLDECSRLERKDAVVTYLDPITTGRVEVAMIENELKENTELISVTAANCQTGTSEPFTGIGTMTSEKGVIFHTDAAFAFGKMPINVERSHIDMLTADASYFGGPENAGFLYVRKSTGAGEYVSETALSEETLTVMSDMAESLAAKATTFMEEIRPVRNHMCERIFAEIEDVELNGHKDHHLTNHLNIRIKNVSAAVVQKALKEEGIEAGIGTNSNILAAIGRSKAESAESVSFSLKAGTTMEDADKIVDSLKEIVTGERTVL
jgi:cysteine desulfurase